MLLVSQIPGYVTFVQRLNRVSEVLALLPEIIQKNTVVELLLFSAINCGIDEKP